MYGKLDPVFSFFPPSVGKMGTIYITAAVFLSRDSKKQILTRCRLEEKGKKKTFQSLWS